MRKLLGRLILLLIVLGVMAFLARNLIARKVVEVGFTRYTGFPLEIESVSVAPAFGHIEVANLHLMNPSDFEEVTFVQMPRFAIDYRIGSMAMGSPHVNEMTINISEVHVVKKANGDSNLEKLSGVAGGSASEPASTQKASARYQVDKLQIHIGKVSIIDKQRNRTQNIELNVDVTYENITEATDITRLVLMTMMTRVKLPDIGVDLGDLTKDLGDVSGVTPAVIQGVAEGAGNAVKGVMDSLKKKSPPTE